HVPLVGLGPRRDLGGGHGSGGRHRLVEAQLVAEVHHQSEDRRAEVAERVAHERLELDVVDRDHWLSSTAGASMNVRKGVWRWFGVREHRHTARLFARTYWGGWAG